LTYPATPPPEPPTPVEPPAYPALRESTDIQGNILSGFRKDRQQLLFVSFSGDTGHARAWLTIVLPRIATTRQVALFNDAFSAARASAGGDDPATLAAVWMNVSLTASGIRTLAGSDPFATETNDAFINGAAASAAKVGDGGTSDPSHWLFGRPDQAIDAVITIQADRESDFRVELERQHAALAAHSLLVVFEQAGATLPGQRAGHEHFGFKDGISQPGVTGFDAPNPAKPTEVQGAPGTDLINPGEFVVGLPDQDRLIQATPAWMIDGSFHVIRRLAQDVPGWWAQVEAQAPTTSAPSFTSDALAAKLVGRWRSGTPLAHAPDGDMRSGRVSDGDNDFEYADDPDGLKTPRFAHIRKAYPRDQEHPGEEEAERHRIMRRGIPFGLPFDPALGRGYGVDAERGLVFAAFMASIEDQFEFIQQQWVNSAGFPNDGDGIDPVIGTGGAVTLKRDAIADQPLNFMSFVTTEGALYAFAPSLATLTLLSSGQTLPE
jgi:Dyp-type peroxidase family